MKFRDQSSNIIFFVVEVVAVDIKNNKKKFLGIFLQLIWIYLIFINKNQYNFLKVQSSAHQKHMPYFPNYRRCLYTLLLLYYICETKVLDTTKQHANNLYLYIYEMWNNWRKSIWEVKWPDILHSFVFICIILSKKYVDVVCT